MAKKFNFKLESVLKYRTEKVSRAKDSLNQAVKLRIDKEKAIIDTADERSGFQQTNTGKIKASDLQAKGSYLNFLEEEIKRLENEKLQILEIEELRRKKLIVAMKDEKVIEKLKEKKRLIHFEEIKKEESKFMDELGLKTINKNR